MVRVHSLRFFGCLATLAFCALISNDATAGTNKTLEKCDQALRKQLVAPLEAKVIDYAFTKDSSTAYICYQARTRGGGFGKAGGTCDFDTKGKILKAELGPSDFIHEVYCNTVIPGYKK